MNLQFTSYGSTGFGDVSGLRANVQKSRIFLARVHGSLREDIIGITGIPSGSMPVRYVGIPFASQGLKVLHYAPLIDKIVDYFFFIIYR